MFKKCQSPQDLPRPYLRSILTFMHAYLHALIPFFPFPISTLKKKKVLGKLRRIVLILRVRCTVQHLTM